MIQHLTVKQLAKLLVLFYYSLDVEFVVFSS